MPTVSGSWRDTATFFNVPSPLHVADPRHVAEEKTPQEYAWSAPPYPYAKPMGREDFGSQEVPDIRGQQLDVTPYTHEEGSVGALSYTDVDDLDRPGGADWDLLAQTHAAHNKAQGASVKQNYSAPTFRFFDERYLFFRIPGFGPETTDPIPSLAGGGQRGLNGLSINNPSLESYLGQGFWPGTTEQAVVDRRFQARIIQRNDERAQTLNLPFFEPDSAPPKPGNQSISPFNTLQRMMQGVFKIPIARRTPPVPGDIQEERASEDVDSPVVEAAFYG